MRKEIEKLKAELAVTRELLDRATVRGIGCTRRWWRTAAWQLVGEESLIWQLRPRGLPRRKSGL